MGLFQTTWRTQVEKLLPPEMRSVSVIDFITSLVHPLQVDIDREADFDEDIRLRAKFNARKMILQEALNTLFPLSAPIYIETQTSFANNVFLYNEAEAIPPLYSYNESEGQQPLFVFNDTEDVDEFDFLVYVPVADYTSELDRRISAEVTIYKLAGKTFDIVTY